MKKIIGIVAVIVCVILAGFAGLQWRGYQKLKDAYAEGLVYFEEKDYAKAGEIFEKSASIHTLFGESIKEQMMAYQAEGYYYLEKYEEAVKLYDRLIKKSPDNMIYYTMKGACFQKSGETDKAKECLQNGWEKTKNTSFLQQLCNISMESGDLESALSYIDTGLKEAGDDAKEFLFDKIIVYEKTQDYENAWKTAQEFQKKYPDDKRGQKEYVFLSTRIQ